MIEKRNIGRAIGRAASLHVTSQVEADEAEAFGFALPPIATVPNGIDTFDSEISETTSAELLEMLRGPNIVLFLGRINWKKGLDRLIPAFSRVPRATLVVAGNDEDNYRPELDQLARRCGVRERVHFVGPVHRTDKAALLRKAKLLVLPSYSENFGNVVLEAMAAGCPVVVTPEVGAASIVERSSGRRYTWPAERARRGDSNSPAVRGDPRGNGTERSCRGCDTLYVGCSGGKDGRRVSGHSGCPSARRTRILGKQLLVRNSLHFSDITPLILTFNEAPNLRSTLSRLDWASQVVIIDSGSADGTLSIASEFSAVVVLHRDFDHPTNQWAFGLSQITTPWTLALDADYLVPIDYADQLRRLDPNATTAGFETRFQYCIYGRPLRATLYPPRTVLFRTAAARFYRDGHTQRVYVEGDVELLAGYVAHDDRKPLASWCASQLRYARAEADKLCRTPSSQLDWKDRLRRWHVLAPPLTFYYCLFQKGLILDGWPGLYYTMQRVYAELLLSLELLDRRVRG